MVGPYLTWDLIWQVTVALLVYTAALFGFCGLWIWWLMRTPEHDLGEPHEPEALVQSARSTDALGENEAVRSPSSAGSTGSPRRSNDAN